MQVSLSPNINSYNSFNAQQSKISTNVLDNALSEKNKLSEKDKIEIQSKKVKSAVKRCIGVIILLDVIYFTMRRSFKYTTIAKVAKKKEKLEKIAKQKGKVKPLKSEVLEINEIVKAAYKVSN